MTASGSDPRTTRSPSEGGWSRLDGTAAGRPEPIAGEPTWDPIPAFRPSLDPRQLVPAEPESTAGPAPVPGGRPEPARRRRLPETVVEYPQLLRGPTRAWWRPIVTLVVFLALFGVLSVLPVLVMLTYGELTGIDGVDRWLDEQLADGAVMDPGGFLYLNLSLIVLIPAAMLSVWAVHRIRPRFLSSVAGGLRWRWLSRCVVVLAPLWAVYLTVSTLTDPPQSPRPEQWAVLLGMGLLLTPWQAAAEEYAFRGWLTQNVGAWFARPVLAFVVPSVLAAALFAAAHGSPDPWILADLVAFSLAASVLTWRTGGLEAAIVLHAINNVGIDVVVTTVGGFEESYIGAETRGTPVSFAVSVLLYGIAVALVLWQARRTSLDPRFRPSGPLAIQPAQQADHAALGPVRQAAGPGHGRWLNPEIHNAPW